MNDLDNAIKAKCPELEIGMRVSLDDSSGKSPLNKSIDFFT